MRRTLTMLALTAIAVGGRANAQSDADRLKSVESEVDALKSTTISGYIQAEWQQFDQTGSAGGRAIYSDARRNFFTIRRGEVKITHRLGSMMSLTILPDITERGVALKEAFVQASLLGDDKQNEIQVNIGAFNRPNYEVEYSSSLRESPERSQVVRAFYPDDRDLGLMVTARHTLAEHFDPRIEVGVFNGPGPVAENDSYKDVIARLAIPLPFEPSGPVRGSIGASAYYGGIPQLIDSMLVSANGATTLVANDDRGGSAPGMGNKRNLNLEGQFTLDLLPFGTTILKGEYLSGRRPTAAVAAVARDTVRFINGSSGTPFQERNQAGYYLYLVQNLGAKFQIAVKADYFDRNTDLAGAQVLSSSDAASTIVGVGINWFVEKIRVTLWYDMPSFAASENVARSSSGVADDLRTVDLKDNKTTLRVQYKF